MKSVKRIVGIAVVAAVVAVIGVSAGMIQKTPEAVQNTVVGKVYGNNITIAQIEPQMQQVYATVEQQVQGNPMENADAKKFIIQQRENAVNSEIVNQIIPKEIEAQKITVSQAEIDAAYQKELDGFIQQAGNDKTKGTEAFNAALKQAGLTEATFKDRLKTQLEDQKLTESITKAVPAPTEADAQSYYNENKSQFTKPAGAQVYQIVVDSEAKANELRTQFLNETKGMTNAADKLKVFEKLASANNVDSTKNTGGSLGYIDYSSTSYVPAFMDAVKSLKAAGDVSAVVNSKTDSYNVYNIVFVSQVNAQPATEAFDQVKDQILQTITQQQQQQAVQAKLKEWEKAAGAEVYTSKLDYAIPTSSTSTSGSSAQGSATQGSTN
ncbi:MAG: peptidyl-prolyl cis-trans isomerase [Sarcina sp.]